MLSKGDKFGDNSLFYNTVRLCKAKAKEKTITLVVGREHLDTLQGIVDPQKHFLTVFVKTMLEGLSSLKDLKKADLEFILKMASLQYQQSGRVMIEEGTPIEYLFILIEGSLKALEDNRVVLDKPGIWGEFRIGEELTETKLAEETITFAQDSVIMKIPIKVINDKVGKSNRLVDIDDSSLKTLLSI